MWDKLLEFHHVIIILMVLVLCLLLVSSGQSLGGVIRGAVRRALGRPPEEHDYPKGTVVCMKHEFFDGMLKEVKSQQDENMALIQVIAKQQAANMANLSTITNQISEVFGKLETDLTTIGNLKGDLGKIQGALEVLIQQKQNNNWRK